MQSGSTSQEQTPEDEVRTTRMPSIQPPPLPPFSPQQIYASLHTTPEPARASSWDTKPGAWWPSLTALAQGRKRSSIVATKRPLPSGARASTILVTGSTIVIVSLFGTYLDLSLTPPGPRDGLAIALVLGRVLLALALAAFGWGLIRLGERLSARS
jgi:hypothetical protein